MAVPYNIWAGMYQSAPDTIAWGIPAIPPSSNPLVVDPVGSIRTFAEHATNADRRQMCTVWDLKCLEDWGKDEANRKVIMEVIKSRLDQGWPHNFKALDVLSVMPVDECVGLIDKLKAFAEASTVEGASELKKLAKPLLDKAQGEVKKKEEEDAKKKQEAMMTMWGGLWANDAVKANGRLTQAGWAGWQWPYAMAPGAPAQTAVEWKGKPPDGWTPSSITAVPQVYPFSRAGYYALLPTDQAPPAAPKAGTYTINVTAKPGQGGGGGVSKTMPLGLDQLMAIWESRRGERGW